MRRTAIIEREGDGYVALCLELDVASQGDDIGRRPRVGCALRTNRLLSLGYGARQIL